MTLSLQTALALLVEFVCFWHAYACRKPSSINLTCWACLLLTCLRMPKAICEGVGFPIQTSPDHCLLPAPRSFSQATTSFFACNRQGIHHVHLFAWSYHLKCFWVFSSRACFMCCLFYLLLHLAVMLCVEFILPIEYSNNFNQYRLNLYQSLLFASSFTSSVLLKISYCVKHSLNTFSR